MNPSLYSRVPFRKPLALIADDHPDSRDLLRVILEMKGCEVVEAENSEQAFSMEEGVHPDIVVVNVTFRDTELLTEVGQLRQQTSPPPHILTSSCATPAFRERALATGCDGFLVKPYDYNQINHILEQLLPHTTECSR